MDLIRQRAAQLRYWREDVSGRSAGAWALLGGVQVHTTGLAPRHWNGAHVVDPRALGAVLPQVADWFAEREKPWGLLVPDELGVVPPGMEHVTDQRVMLRGTVGLPPAPLPDGLTVRADAPPADVARVQAEGFGDPYDVALAFAEPQLRAGALPPQTTLTAYDAAEPVGVATLARMGDVAGVYGVAVRAGWRRRGIGAALTAAVVREAARAGCDLVYLNPSDEGYGVYARLGFVDAPPYRIWHPRDGAPTP